MHDSPEIIQDPVESRREKEKEYQRQYYLKHREEILEQRRQKWQENKAPINEKKKAYNKEWVKNNPDKVKQQHAKYYETHREEIRERSKKQRKENPERYYNEEIRERQKTW